MPKGEVTVRVLTVGEDDFFVSGRVWETLIEGVASGTTRLEAEGCVVGILRACRRNGVALSVEDRAS